MRILVVEDEAPLRKVIAEKLKKEHYSVDDCGDGAEALDCLLCAEYDAVILDIMLPQVNGLEVLRRLRAKGNTTPVLLLTAKDTIEDRVTGLDAGADDYLIKPFSFEELTARIRVMLRRSSGAASNVFTVADLVVDCDARTVTRSGEPIALTKKEFAVLEVLVRNTGIVLSREKISHHIWSYEYEGGSNVVDVYIRYLRKKIDAEATVKLIHTVRGAGYVLRVEP